MLAEVNSVDTNVYHVAGIKPVSLFLNIISGCQRPLSKNKTGDVFPLVMVGREHWSSDIYE